MQEKIVTYVYEDREVYLTGRIAKSQRSGMKPTMVEVVPVGTPPGDKDYAKWVRMVDLLVINNLEDEQIE